MDDGLCRHIARHEYHDRAGALSGSSQRPVPMGTGLGHACNPRVTARFDADLSAPSDGLNLATCFGEALKRIDVIVLASIPERVGRTRLIWAWVLAAYTVFLDFIFGPILRPNWGLVPLTKEMDEISMDYLLVGSEDYLFASLRLGLIALLVWYAVKFDWRGLLLAGAALAIWHGSGVIFMLTKFPGPPS